MAELTEQDAEDRAAYLEGLTRLNLGCGRMILDEPYVNVDAVALPGVDVVCDLDTAPWPWPDGSVGLIQASHVFEHVANPVLFMTEAWRVLAEDGLIDIRCPWYKHMNAYTDPTHKRYCTEETWDYWCEGTGLFAEYGASLGGGPDGARFRKAGAGVGMVPGLQGAAEVRVVLAKLA